MFEDTFFPEWLAPFLVSDDVFGAAYEAVAPERRAWLKTSIARLYTVYGASGETWGRHERQWRQGFVTVSECQPVAWAVIVMPQNYVSAPRLIAALMPALLAGVRNVLVVRVGNSLPWSDTILAGLELAGQEAVVSLTEEGVRSLLEYMQEQGAGRCVLLGSQAAGILPEYVHRASQTTVWEEPDYTAIAVVAGDVADGDVIDEELLAWAHPDLTLCPLDMEGAEDVEGVSGCFPDSESFAAFAGTADMIDLVPDTIPLMIGPGQEGCWIWPDLEPSFFVQRRMTLVTEM